MRPNSVSLVRAQAASIVPLVLRAIRKIRGVLFNVDADAVRGGIEAWLSQHPLRGATKRQAALHEAGHLIAYEFDGMIAGKACIEGSPFGRGSWGGGAWCIDTPNTTHGPCANDPNEFLREARGVLAGAFAEAMLGDGDALSSVGELAEARFLTARAAEILGHDKSDIWHETLTETAAIVERHASEIEEIADLLMRRRRVNRFECSTGRILTRVGREPIVPAALSMGSKELAQLVETTVARFVDMQWMGAHR